MTESFLQSMTFAQGGSFANGCDCEECESMPASIRKFLQDRKRQRFATGPIKRTQQRTLVTRDGQMSVWCMHMPKNADPLVEYGSNHRIVWVKQLAAVSRPGADGTNDKSAALSWIGQGIIGSSDEEKSRTKMSRWTEGSFFLVPSNGGKAVGWIYHAIKDAMKDASGDSDSITNGTDDNKASSTIPKEKSCSASDAFAVLYVAKIPPSALDKQESTERNDHWSSKLINFCRDGLLSCEKESNEAPIYYKYSEEDSKLLKKTFREADGTQANHDVTERASKRICMER